MARYSVAASNEELNDLITKALAGEEVILTSPDRPTMALRLVVDQGRPKLSNAEWMERLRKLRASQPISGISYLDLKRMDEADGLL